MPKQFARWRGKPLLRYSVETLLAAGANPVVIAIPDGAEELAGDALAELQGVRLVTGGASRQLSVKAALEALTHEAPEYVLIHDAARPHITLAVVTDLLAALESHPAAIPVLPVVDSLAIDRNGLMSGSANREELRRVQTPQAFRFPAILAAHRAWTGEANAGDDAQVAHALNLEIALVQGDEVMRKLTFAEDFMGDEPPIRMGTGYDVHRLADNEELWLCGVKIEHPQGLAGHSDADVAMHALTDALLGAIGAGDIGQHFPPSDPEWRGVSSSRFLEHAVVLVTQAGYRIGNTDVTIVCEAPKIGPYRDRMRARLAELMSVDIGCISVKATTTERLGFTGRGEGIAAQAAATLIQAS